MKELPTRYNPQETEDGWYRFWEDQGLFHAVPDTGNKPFSIVIPPPNVTGILHMGHALNNTIQDILIRCHRMTGERALWMPGIDHAGIATQNVVEKALAREGRKRQDLGRDAFIERVWKWREEYGSTIIRQLKKLGASCDWARTRFTMDEQYSQAVVEVFVALYEKGLIYRGNYIINWCPRCQTALSDEEAPHHALSGHLYYLHYPLKDNPKEYITVATTRPETMLGDTAVAVNPEDERYKKYIGKTLVLPLVNREIPVIADELVDREFGTGAVKVTPAHDPNDYVMGKKHNLEFVNVMHPDARMNERAGDYQNMDRYEAREVIVEDLKELKLLERIEPHDLSAGHCYRCHTIVEPYLSPQWFVKMKPLAGPAIKAVEEGRIVFHPERWTKVYLNWMENIQDWCISRQIWWGHRIPVYYCDACSGAGKGVIVARRRPDKCPFCGSEELRQDEDVLDTWFSSWLWPFATFGWPQKNADLDYFYPTAVLVTAPEIIFFWVARMIMAGFEFMGEAPFKDVYIHGTVRDVEGKKMSKSLGNIIDPLEIIKEYGADALRFSIISITAQGQDVFLSRERFEQGRNFANKIWNASRLVLMNIDEKFAAGELAVLLKSDSIGLINRWIVSRFNSVLRDLREDLVKFKFNEAAQLLYGFFWHEFCDWYLEVVKTDFGNPATQTVMQEVLKGFLKALHPFMPFVTEELWQRFKPEGAAAGSITGEGYPQAHEADIDRGLEERVAVLFGVVTAVRNLRATLGIKNDQKANISLFPHSEQLGALLEQQSGLIKTMASVEYVKFLPEAKRPEATLSALIADVDIYLHFGGLIDTDKEVKRINSQIDDKKKWIRSKSARLKDQKFLERAPEEVVAKERDGLAQAENELERLEQMLKELS